MSVSDGGVLVGCFFVGAALGFPGCLSLVGW